MATKDNRIIITQDAGFRRLLKPKGSGIFIIPSYLSNDKIDTIITDFISNKDPEEFKGEAIKI